MATQLVAVASLLLGSAFLLIAGGLHGLLLPTFGVAHGFTTTELGLLGTGWAAGFVARLPGHPARSCAASGTSAATASLASVAAVTILLNAADHRPVGVDRAPRASPASASPAPRWSWKAG